MKLGLGLKSFLMTDERLALAKQLGCDSVVAWVPFPENEGAWGIDDLSKLRERVNSYGLELAAIENFNPAQWDHIVLDEDGKQPQMDNICQTIQNAGEVGIECFGYSFSGCGVQGYYSDFEKEPNKDGRGGATTRHFDINRVDHSPQPNQNFWFKTTIERRAKEGFLPPVGEEEMWARFEWFLKNVLPVAESAGIKLCAHPDDPPIPFFKGIYRPLHSVAGLRKLLSLVDSPSNCLEFCQGTVSTMADCDDIYSIIEEFASKDKIGYVHFRNTTGRLPRFSEVFIDNGYVDMSKALDSYHKAGFKGTLIPDHTPTVSSDAPWDTGMGYNLGCMRGIMLAKKY